MENSLGNFYKFIEGFEKYEHMCGGFIWDFVDQAIRKAGLAGNELLYGDDFKEKYSKAGFKRKFLTGGNGIFCCNGIVAADRTPHPAAMEVKKGYQILHVEATGSKQNVFHIVNNQMFNDLSLFRLLWKLECNGEPVIDGEVSPENFSGTPPGESTALKLDEFRLDALRLEDVQQARGVCEYTLIFSFIQRDSTPWADAGFEQAFSQIVYPPSSNEKSAQTVTKAEPLKTKRVGGKQFVKGDGFEYIFEGGVLISIVIDREELLEKPLIPNLWREPTDNDFGFGNFFDPAKKFMSAVKWKNAGSHQIAQFWHKRESSKGIEIITDWKHPLCRKLQTVCTVFPDGKLEIDLIMQPKKIDAVRNGLQLVLIKGFDKATWYGRGPHENYPDRKTGARLAKYTAQVEDIEHRYVRPQENGARCDVRWLTVSSGRKKVNFKDLSGDGMMFSAWHYEQSDLAAASHDYLLMRKPLTTISIDSAMCGVGGDLPGIAALHKEYKLPGNREYKLQIGIEII